MVKPNRTSKTRETEHLVVIFAYHYPPDNAIGAARPYRFAKYLSRLGYTCRVFTAADQHGRYDSNIEYVEDPFPARRNFSWQFERAVRKIFLPGEVGMLWSLRASRAACKYISAHPCKTITVISSFPPLGAHLAGWQTARRSKCAWIADCRDSFTDKPSSSSGSDSQQYLYRWMERVAVRTADGVIVNTDVALTQLNAKFPSSAGKIHVIWNGFDPEELIGPLPVGSQICKTFSHVGELYHGRNVSPLIESVSRLVAANRLSANSIRIRLIGPAESDCLPESHLILRARSEGWLDLVTERVPQSDARQIAQSSSGLLLIQSECASHVPAKIFEYIQIGRPILAFTWADSPAERLLKRSGVPFRSIYPNAAPEAVDNILADFFSIPSTPIARSAWFDDEFNAEKQTLQLDAIIRSTHRRRRTREAANSIVPAKATALEQPESAGVYQVPDPSSTASIDRY